MNTASRKPADSVENVNPPPNGLNHDSDGWIARSPALLPYTATNATTAKIARISNSRPSRITWVRADSSIPIQAISVITRIQMEPTIVTAVWLLDRCEPNSENV